MAHGRQCEIKSTLDLTPFCVMVQTRFGSARCPLLRSHATSSSGTNQQKGRHGVLELPEDADWIEGQRLAERAIGPLALTGFRFVGDLAPDLSFELEEWYAVGAPTTHLIERHNVMSDGSVSETRVIAVARTTVPENMFDVPEGYTVLDLIRPRNGLVEPGRVRP